MNFGSSTWNNSTGFGATANSNTASAAPTAPTTGLFGNSTQNNQNNLFGNTQKPGSGLFSNTQDSSNKKPNGGLFGNASSSQPSGGLFGNSSTSTGGGLFGNSNTGGSNSTGLFGNTSAPNTSSGTTGSSLFNKPAASGTSGGGLFGSSNTGGSTGGLFGNKSNTTATSATGSGSGGLFGSSNTANGIGAGTGGGLFNSGNSSSVFNKPAASGGLFGNTSSTQQPQPQAPQSSVATNDPYNSGKILYAIQRSTDTMPASLTGSLFASSEPPLHLPSISGPVKQPQRKSSLLGKLAQTFNIFRYTSDLAASNSSVGKLKGLFTQSNYIRENVGTLPSLNLGVKKPQKPHARQPIENKSVGEMKRLVIQSRPHKFHQINADKVFSAKKRRVLILSLDNQLLGDAYEDVDVDDSTNDSHKHGDAIKKDRSPVEDGKSETTEDPKGYWCSPSIAELEKMTREQLSSVDSFIVGRKSKGQIAYIFPVDLTTIFDRCRVNDIPVSSVLFDDIIKIEDGIVKVYFDYEAAKPPISRELNVPAIITLKSEPKKRSLDEHIKRLKRVVGAEFVTYDPIEHYWTFKVKHFSVWGLIEDSEEDDETEEQKRIREIKKKQDAEEDESTKQYSRIYENPEYQNELKRQKVIKQSEGIPGAWDYGSIAKHDSSLAIKQRLVEDEITRQMQLYKEEQSANALAANVSDITVQSSSEDEDEEDELALAVPAAYTDSSKFDYLKQIVSVLPPYTDMRNLVDEKAYEPVLDSDEAFHAISKRADLPTSDDWLVQLELSNDINSALTPYTAIPRKSGLALRNVSDIMFSDFNKSSVGMDQVSTPIKEMPAAEEFKPDFDITSMTKLVQTLLLNATVKPRQNGLPFVRIPPRTTFAELSAIDVADTDLLNLASILFDPVEIKESEQSKNTDEQRDRIVTHLKSIKRRRELSKWLQKHNKSSFPTSNDNLERILYKVLNGEIKDAIEISLSSKNAHLATVLATLDANDAVAKRMAKSQLAAWPAEDQLVPDPIRQIYQILSGDFDKVVVSYKPAIKLGVLVHYSSVIQPLHKILDKVDFDDDKSSLASLLRVYLEFTLNGKEAAGRLLQKSNINIVVKWMLAEVLDLDPKTQDLVCEAFGKDLERVTLWKEAIFIYAMTNDDTAASKLLRRAVLDNIKHIKGDSVDEEEYLATVLVIPRSLIYEAVAEEKNREKDYWGKGDALVTAGLWEQAHENIVKQIGPAAVIEENQASWARLMSIIDRFPDNGRIIPSWNQGGGLFAAYFHALLAEENLEDPDRERVTFLLENLAQYRSEGDFKQHAALCIMAKTVGDLALFSLTATSDLKEKLMAIEMGENEKSYFQARFAAID